VIFTNRLLLRQKAGQPLYWHQTIIQLEAQPRGFHLVTHEIVSQVPGLASLRVGLLHLLLRHTSASLFLNENADPDVRADFSHWTDHAIPDGARYFVHSLEGADDMPAHMKSGLLGVTLTLPISDGHLQLGTWQGIYLGEHRSDGGSRSVVATLWGELKPEKK
jgi:secondary thiamine-phosphate synthase enzyme